MRPPEHLQRDLKAWSWYAACADQMPKVSGKTLPDTMSEASSLTLEKLQKAVKIFCQEPAPEFRTLIVRKQHFPGLDSLALPDSEFSFIYEGNHAFVTEKTPRAFDKYIGRTNEYLNEPHMRYPVRTQTR